MRRADGGSPSSTTINRRIKRSTATSTGGPGTVATMRRSDASNRRAARAAHYTPRSDRQIARTPIRRPEHVAPGTVSTMQHADRLAHEQAVKSGYTPRTTAQIAAAPVHFGEYAHRATLRHSEAGASGGVVGGALRVVGHSIGGIAQAVYHDPVAANVKAVGTLVDAAKAVPQIAGLAGGLAITPTVQAAEAVAGRNLSDVDEQSVQAAKDMAKGVVKSYSDKYGPSFRGEKGSGAKLRKQIEKEGPLPTTLDLATVAGPSSAALGKAARLGTLGRRLQNVATRDTLVRYGPHDVVPVAPRRGIIGIGTREAHNAARRAAQRRAVKRAEAGKPHGRPGDRRLGLPAHRATLQEGEVAPVLNARAARRQRYLVAKEDNATSVRVKQRLHKFVGGATGILQAHRLVKDPELRPLIGLTRQLGIRGADDVAKIVPARLAQIDRATEEARRVIERRKVGRDSDVPKGTPQAEADAGLLEHLDELTTERRLLESLVENPRLADTAGLAEAAERTGAIHEQAVGGREGLSASRKASGRTARQGETLGIKTADELNAEAEAAHATTLAHARAQERAARDEREAAKARVKRELDKARADVEVAKGRAAVTGPGQARRKATLQARREHLARVQERASTELSEHSAIVRARTEARQAVAKVPPRRIKETAQEYAARVDQEFADRGLARPAYAPGHYEAPEDATLVKSTAGARQGPANVLRHKSEGTTARLGAQAFDPATEKDLLVSNIKRGAKLESEANVLQKHGFYFDSREDAETFVRGLGGAAARKDGREGGWEIVAPTLVRKDTEGLVIPERELATDRGDYIAGHGGVFAIPAPVLKEMQALGGRPSAPITIARRLAHAPQTALLAMSPSWFVFQRVNDLVGMAFGGSLLQARGLQKLRRELRAEDPDAADIVELMSGGSASRTQLNPYSGQHLGRMQRVIDENPRLRDAWNSDQPAFNLLGLSPRLINSGVWIAKKAPTALLRTDARITEAVREGQYLQNLRRFAEKADPDVKAVIRATGPMGHAFKTADTDLMRELLTSPKYAKAREDAAEALNRVMGDWHTFTAAERSVKDFAAFYGFLRYSTRMLMYTLPVDHPLLALTVAQLGSYSADYARSIIGDDVPYGLGALYSKAGTVITDLTRANPLTGPLMSVDKPEKLVGLATPLASISMSALFGVNIGLSDSASGYMNQLSFDRNSSDHSMTWTDRAQVLLDQTMSLLSPYKAVKGMDTRPQTSDSLLGHRQYTVAKTPQELVKLRAKQERAGKGGVDSMLADFFPLFFSDGRNWRKVGENATAMKAQAHEKQLDAKAKFEGAKTPLGRSRNEVGAITEQINQEVAAAGAGTDDVVKQIQRELQAQGLTP